MDKVAELTVLLEPESTAAWIARYWNTFNQQRQPKIAQWAELSKYIFATDTTTTANKLLPWTHTTTIPKLTQIRDNLHSNYLSGLFPNDKWLTWVAYDKEAASREQADKIEYYMENKTREGGFRNVISQLIYDYIDYGNAFAMPDFVTRYKTTKTEKVASFIGPKCVRISPYDIVFNPTAMDFVNTPKVIRSVKTLGELAKLAKTNPDQRFWQKALDKRLFINRTAKGYSMEDWVKASQYSVDGFGNLQEYYQSNSVEILEFYGDYYNSDTGELFENRMITVVDRTTVVRDVEIPSYGGEALIRMVGWRKRPDNLWCMGPLDNLVGMQYMIDHYINMGANALDLKVMPPKKIIGEVEEFTWEPNAEIHIDENGDVQELAQTFGDIVTLSEWIKELEFKMELYAGAPREAMGMRTPGEKTAFEVQVLDNAAGRIFQEKITQFEVFMEDVLNDMLETAHRHMTVLDLIRIIDTDIGVQRFLEITKEDISANGIVRPVGARHFSQQATELQNLVGIFNSPIGAIVAPHTSSKAMTKFIEDVVNLRGYSMFSDNIAIQEGQERQLLLQQAQEDVLVQGQMTEEQIMMEAQ